MNIIFSKFQDNNKNSSHLITYMTRNYFPPGPLRSILGPGVDDEGQL